ncbi:hypothetical protein [Lacinutrix sp.]|uniref:hypothetical protein n=1 Tax=Lacinutrix sp. TaxID=1937692 RepID=UPI0025BE5285|nr:hypothetical protein [Lacinutrix sp.]
MKKIIYIVLLCTISIAFSQEKRTEKRTEEKTAINTELKFGKYTDCLRPGGICTFNVNSNKSQTNTTATYNKDNTVTLIIDRTKITKEDEVKIFGKQLDDVFKVNELVFVMDENFVLEKEIKSSLKTPEQVTKLAKGNYPIQITKETITITIKLE